MTTVLVIGTFPAAVALGGPMESYELLLLFPAIIISALLFDSGNGIYATLLGAVLAAFALLPPRDEFALQSSSEVIALALFLGVGVFIALIVERLHVTLVNLANSYAQLESIANERAILMDELTHRTRNNLATIASLLRLQAKSADATSASVLSAAADRVHVLSRVHERLTIRGSRAVVDSREFILELCNDLKAVLIGTRPIALELSIESHPIGIQKAVSIGLAINELMTNALKYAFDDEQSGLIKIGFVRIDDEYRLSIADNGVGKGDRQLGGGLGLRLVGALATQLGGNLRIDDAKPGTIVTVTFLVPPAARQANGAPGAKVVG